MKIYRSDERFIKNTNTKEVGKYQASYLYNIDYRDFLVSLEFACLFLGKKDSKIKIIGNNLVKEKLKIFLPKLVLDDSEEVKNNDIIANLGNYDINLKAPCLQIVSCNDSNIIRDSLMMFAPFGEPFKGYFIAIELNDNISPIETSSLSSALINHGRLMRPNNIFSPKWRSFGNFGYDEATERYIASQYLKKFNIEVSINNVKSCVEKFRNLTNLEPVIHTFGYTGKKIIALDIPSDYSSLNMNPIFVRPSLSQIFKVFNMKGNIETMSDQISKSPDPASTVGDILSGKEPDYKLYGSAQFKSLDTANLIPNPQITIEGLLGDYSEKKERISTYYNGNISNENTNLYLSLYPAKNSIRIDLEEKLIKMELGSILVIITQNSTSLPGDRIICFLNQIACCGLNRNLLNKLNDRNKIIEPSSAEEILKIVEKINSSANEFSFYNWKNSSGLLLGQNIIILSKTLS